MAAPEPAYKAISAAKRAERDSKIPAEWRITLPADDDNLMDLPRTCGIFSARELEITETADAVALLEQIHAGAYSAVEVARAFCKRAAVAQQALNCLTEIFFEDAYTRAAHLDAEFARTGKPVGPLHGLPVSLKDSINVAGIDSTIGMAAYAFAPEPQNSVIVDMLLQLGAVLYCKTNVPQSMMTPDTENNVFGQTRNPRSKYITAAGSSGGLGALVAFRGCFAGIGTDVGGSVRTPAYCNGVYGIKPSSGRLPYHLLKGYLHDGAETTGILCVNGIIAISLRDCELLLRTISTAQPWLQDPSCAYLPWDPPADIPGRPLVLGVIRDDHETTPLPPVARVLDETLAALRAAGHEVLDLGPFPHSAELSANAVAHFKIDGGAALAATMARTDEPYTPSVLAGGLYPCAAQPLPKLYEYAASRARLQHAWLRLWASTSSRSASGRPLDAILCPVQGSVPRPHETLLRSHFTRNWNVLDYPAAVVQCGTCSMARDDVPLPMPPPSEAMERVYEIYSEDKRGRYEGFPLALQVVGQRQQEARLLAVCKVVDEVVHR